MAYVLPAGETRAGFVTRREIGGAVVRNRARRLLRESWRAVVPLLSGAIEVVFVARPPIAEARMPEVAEEMRRLLALTGVMSE
jgi:ribonuclease P protein component